MGAIIFEPQISAERAQRDAAVADQVARAIAQQLDGLCRGQS
jgi:hypothetical protein